MCFTLYRTSRKLGRDSRIRSKQKFITKALRGGRLLTLSSETTRSPGCIREILQKKLAKEGRHSREKKKSEQSTNAGDETRLLCYEKFVSVCIST